MSEWRIETGAFGTVVVHRPCGMIVVDEDRPTERDVEEAMNEHECLDRTEWDHA